MPAAVYDNQDPTAKAGGWSLSRHDQKRASRWQCFSLQDRTNAEDGTQATQAVSDTVAVLQPHVRNLNVDLKQSNRTAASCNNLREAQCALLKLLETMRPRSATTRTATLSVEEMSVSISAGSRS